MKIKTVLLIVMAISALMIVACSPQEVVDNSIQEPVADQSPEDTVSETAQEELLTDDDFVEIGEMI